MRRRKVKLLVFLLIVTVALTININIKTMDFELGALVWGIRSSYEPWPWRVSDWKTWYTLDDKPDTEVYFINAHYYSGGNSAQILNYDPVTGNFILRMSTRNSEDELVYDSWIITGSSYSYNSDLYNYEYDVIDRYINYERYPYVKISRTIKNLSPIITITTPSPNSPLQALYDSRKEAV